MSPPAETLTALGFTETEALIYCELLGSSPATGYRIAQAVGKAPANTYQALSVLVQKGAAMVDESEGKCFRAVPPAELLAALATTFEARRTAASDALEPLVVPAKDDRIYQLKSPDQVMQRALTMVEGAREILLFDLFPEPFETLRPALERSAREGTVVAGVTYGPAAQAPAKFTVVRGADYVASRWPGRQVTVVADAREHLAALLSRDGASVLHGTWSDSAWLACMHHNGLACEIQLLSIPAAGDNPLAGLSLTHSAPPGLGSLLGSAPAEDAHGDAA
ncbi:MAG TPA: helix-turn-helix domain-containing protein [Gemmatimonadaceae bacterium]|nr:helix-turn-helix domain-containing protein [Gemmatimonadaceae bacterium]